MNPRKKRTRSKKTKRIKNLSINYGLKLSKTSYLYALAAKECA
tara:strand:+ start:2947 stop:3075 length:129 start_codon:yes stop_codon:yes gene_type:complete